MNPDVFIARVLQEILKSPHVSDTSFLRSSLRAVGRKFESGTIDAAGAVADIERLLPWQLSRDIKKGIEKSLR